jgi:hypothetical protein
MCSSATRFQISDQNLIKDEIGFLNIHMSGCMNVKYLKTTISQNNLLIEDEAALRTFVGGILNIKKNLFFISNDYKH